MLNYTIKDEATPVINKLKNGYQKTVSDGIKAFLAKQQKKLKDKTPPQSHRSQPFVSDRQRKWFFWALNSGFITSPYQRTGQLENGWYVGGSGWEQFLQNKAPYADYVVGDKQSKYHKDNWYIASEEVEEDVDELEKIVAQDIQELID